MSPLTGEALRKLGVYARASGEETRRPGRWICRANSDQDTGKKQGRWTGILFIDEATLTEAAPRILAGSGRYIGKVMDQYQHRLV